MTHRLIQLVRREWASFDGEMASLNVDPMRLPPDRFFNLVHWWAIRHATDKADVDKFNRQLWRPPPGMVPPAGSPWSAEAENAAFAALAAEVGVQVTGKTRQRAPVPPKRG